MAEDRRRIAVAHVAKSTGRRQSDSDASRLPSPDHRLGDFEEEAGPVFHAAAVAVGSVIGSIPKELIDEISVGSMDFYPIKSGLLGQACRLGIVGHDSGNLIGIEGSWSWIRFLAGRRVNAVTAQCDGRRGHGQSPAGLKIGMGRTAHVPELDDDLAAGCMDRVGDPLPPPHLLVVVEARSVDPSGRLLGDDRGFADDQSCRRPLPVVFDHEVVGNPVGTGATPGERGHDHAVGQLEIAGREGREKTVHVRRSYCEVDTNRFEALRRAGSGRCRGCCWCRVYPPLVTLRGFPVARAGFFAVVSSNPSDSIRPQRGSW